MDRYAIHTKMPSGRIHSTTVTVEDAECIAQLDAADIDAAIEAEGWCGVVAPNGLRIVVVPATETGLSLDAMGFLNAE
jgi:hypothetical protein